MKTLEVYGSAENVYSIYKTDLDKTIINECINFQKSYTKFKTLS